MESTEHLLVGAIVSAAALVPASSAFETPALVALFAFGVWLSVFIDLDHFLIARYRTGDWRHFRRVLADPTNAVRGQEWIFDDVPDAKIRSERLLGHVLIGGALTAALAIVAPAAAIFVAVVVYAHLLCDLLRDNRLL